jgi:dTDP-4-amino-4,6-dideoxygalactose transaminase
MKIPFHRPILPKNINELLQKSTQTGWLTTGPQVSIFEDKLKQLVKAKYVVAVNSCTAALHLGLIAASLKKGDQFIVPTHTFVASAEVGEYINAIPVFVDSNLESYNMDLNQVEDALIKDKSNKIKVIIPVHFAGNANDMEHIYQLSHKYGIFILEDAAHALETKSNKGKVGDTEHAAAFSFYANKNITTGGEGGAITTNNERLAKTIKSLSLHGMSRDGWKRFKIGNKWEYDVSRLGYKYNMTDISASFGIDQLKFVSEWHRKRIKTAEKYNQELINVDGIITPFFNSKTVHAWHLYVIRIIPEKWEINRNDIISKLSKLGIGTTVHYKSLHLLSYYKNKYSLMPDDFPNAKTLSETSISLPIYPDLSTDEVNYIVNSIFELWERYKV